MQRFLKRNLFSLNRNSRRFFCSKELVAKKEETLELNETQAKLHRINNSIPLSTVNPNVLNEAIKYKVFEDSISPTAEKIQKDIPQVGDHKSFREWVDEVVKQDKQDEILQTHGIVILKKKNDPFIKYGIDMHHYRNYHDREYVLDIQHELTKDLYEKQRVVDNLVEENKKAVDELIGYFDNQFKHVLSNKFSFLIYKNNYNKQDFKKLRKNLIKHILLTFGVSTLLASLNPLLLGLVVPEYFAILYSMIIFNRVVDEVILLEDKQQIIIRKFNFLGYRMEYPKDSHYIYNIRNLGKFHNKLLNLKDRSLSLIQRFLSNDQSQKELDNFKYFHEIKIDNRKFLIPADLTIQHKDTNEELILAILNKDLKYIYEYDYTKYHQDVSELKRMYEDYQKERAIKSHSVFQTEEEKLQQKYSKFKDNRDYADEYYSIALKRTDGTDGTYVNNGYR